MGKYNCVLCGYMSRVAFCPECMESARKHFDVICEYIKDNPNPTMIEVYGSTSIPFGVIKGLLDLGWLELIHDEENSGIKVSRQ